MKKAVGIFLGVAFCVTLLAGPVFALDKLAYVDLSRAFGEYSKTKDYDKVLGDKEGVYTGERDKKVADIKAFKEKYDLLSDKEKVTKKADMEEKLKALQEFDRQKQTDLRKEQDEKMKEILKDIEDAVKQVAEKDGYTMVFNDRVLVYQTKTLDISDKVLAILNAKYVKK